MLYGNAVAVPGDHIAITTDPATEPFWQAAKEHRLTAAECGNCGTFRMPPTPFCWNCQSQDTKWPTLSGIATIFSFAICTKSPYPGDVPDFVYVPIVVDLEGAPGARLVSNYIGSADEVEIGMKVMVDWNTIQDGWNSRSSARRSDAHAAGGPEGSVRRQHAPDQQLRQQIGVRDHRLVWGVDREHPRRAHPLGKAPLPLHRQDRIAQRHDVADRHDPQKVRAPRRLRACTRRPLVLRAFGEHPGERLRAHVLPEHRGEQRLLRRRQRIGKRFLLGAAAAAGTIAAPPVFAARQTVIRFGLDLTTDHPTTVNLTAAAKKIKDATNGEVDVQVFPNSQLGNDTHMLSNLRSGAIQMMAIGDNILATLVPSAAIDNIGFAFKSPEMAWKALDGKVGELVRADIQKTGLHAMTRIWDEGFREITSSTKQVKTPDDLHGFKMRVPPSPISLSLFQALGASPVTINAAELYTALQTHVVDGQENPLGNIQTMKLDQVQKYCSLTNHMWVGYWLLMNGTFWAGLPPEHQKIVADTFDAQALEQRAANQKLDGTLEETLKKQGMEFTTPDTSAFQAVLTKSGFYKTWEDKFGAPLWSALESITGKLA